MNQRIMDKVAVLFKAAACDPGKVHTCALEADTEPTEAQKKAGNYRKGHFRLHGLEITVENPAGSSRSGTSRDGRKWSTLMRHHYGYIRGTVGAEGEDSVDCFVNPENPETFMVYVVIQNDPATGNFDEYKCMLGFRTKAEAEKAYLSNYEKGWKGFGGILSMTIGQFKTWLARGRGSKKPRRAIVQKEAAMEPSNAAVKAGFGKIMNRVLADLLRKASTGQKLTETELQGLANTKKLIGPDHSAWQVIRDIELFTNNRMDGKQMLLPL